MFISRISMVTIDTLVTFNTRYSLTTLLHILLYFLTFIFIVIATMSNETMMSFSAPLSAAVTHYFLLSLVFVSKYNDREVCVCVFVCVCVCVMCNCGYPQSPFFTTIIKTNALFRGMFFAFHPRSCLPFLLAQNI